MLKKILIVEDEKTTALMIQHYLKDLNYEVAGVFTKGEEAINSISQADPDLVLMDITLDGELDGIETATQITATKKIPMVFITASCDNSTFERALLTGLAGYILKPIDKRELKFSLELAFMRQELELKLKESEQRYSTILSSIGDAVIVVESSGLISYINPVAEKIFEVQSRDAIGRELKNVISLMFNSNNVFQSTVIPDHIYLNTKSGKKIPVDYTAAPMNGMNGETKGTVIVIRDDTSRVNAEQKLKDSYLQLKNAMIGIIKAMAQTIETRDPYTAGHQRRVADLARTMATSMSLKVNQVECIYMSALIHDLGKISIPAEILSKPGRISEIEFNLIKTHPHVAYEILKTIDFPWPLAEIVYQHHERIDGSGYPRGLLDKDILLEAKIISVADVVEALASHRPYRAALGINVALDEIYEKSGIWYSPEVVDCCLKVFNEGHYELT